jgi:two-component system cell cycle sensor histidine kinase/response regulator CckA
MARTPSRLTSFLGPATDGKRAAYIVDIAAWKALENQVAQAGKMQAVGQLASGVAHDFNNMLTAIRLNVGELLSRHPVGDPSYQDLQQINATVTRQAGPGAQIIGVLAQADLPQHGL